MTTAKKAVSSIAAVWMIVAMGAVATITKQRIAESMAVSVAEAPAAKHGASTNKPSTTSTASCIIGVPGPTVPLLAALAIEHGHGL